jgi:hypothetical protein
VNGASEARGENHAAFSATFRVAIRAICFAGSCMVSRVTIRAMIHAEKVAQIAGFFNPPPLNGLSFEKERPEKKTIF